MFENAGPEFTLARKVNLIFRFSYTLPFILSSIVGLVASIGSDAPSYIYGAVPLSVMFLAVFVNFSNDYFDRGTGVDMARAQRVAGSNRSDDEMMTKLYWDGNQFDNGNVSPAEGRRLMVLIVTLAIVCAIPILTYKPMLTVMFGAIGLFAAYFYTAPPIDFGGRGMGEGLVTLSFFMLTYCPYYLITETFSIEVILVATIVAITVGLMRAVDSMSAQEIHIKNGEKSISTMFGMDAVASLVKIVVVSVYLIVAVLVATSGLAFLLMLLTLPIARRLWKTVSAKESMWEVAAAPKAFGMATFSQIILIISLAVSYVL